MWATKGEGAGSWIAVDMKDKMMIESFTILNRKNPQEDNKDVSVTFDGDQAKKTITLQQNYNRQTFYLDTPVHTQNVKFTMDTVYGTINNGGCINIYGFK